MRRHGWPSSGMWSGRGNLARFLAWQRQSPRAAGVGKAWVVAPALLSAVASAVWLEGELWSWPERLTWPRSWDLGGRNAQVAKQDKDAVGFRVWLGWMGESTNVVLPLCRVQRKPTVPVREEGAHASPRHTFWECWAPQNNSGWGWVGAMGGFKGKEAAEKARVHGCSRKAVAVAFWDNLFGFRKTYLSHNINLSLII